MKKQKDPPEPGRSRAEVSLGDCSICARLGREGMEFLRGLNMAVPCVESEQLVKRKLTPYELPEFYGMARVGGSAIWRCGRCHTYYLYDCLDRGWPGGPAQCYLSRLNFVKFMAHISGYRDKGPEGQESRWLRGHSDDIVSELKVSLTDPQEFVREYAAEALVDYHKTSSEWSAVAGFLKHPDEPVRRGALVSLTGEFSPTRNGFFPVNYGPVLAELVRMFKTDPAEKVRVSAGGAVLAHSGASALRGYIGEIPESRRLPDHKLWLLDRATFGELVLYLTDSDDGVRRRALGDLFSHCYCHREDIPKIRAAVAGLPDKRKTEQTREFMRTGDPYERGRPASDDDD